MRIHLHLFLCECIIEDHILIFDEISKVLLGILCANMRFIAVNPARFDGTRGEHSQMSF